MSDLDITPPPVPGKKEGFLKKFLFKEEKASTPNIEEIKRKLGLDEPVAPPQAAQPQQALPSQQKALPDLEEIKQKLGLSDEQVQQPAPEPMPAPAPEPTAKVEVDDWSSETTHTTLPAWTAPKEQSPWDAELEVSQEDIAADELKIDEPPVHHEAVEQHLEPLAKEQEKVEKTLQIADQRPEVPEWSLQEKEITPDQYFILRNGQPIRSLKELIDALDYIDDTTFAHHVNEYRNDFANWVRDVINDGDLADEIQATETRPEMVKTLLTHERKVAKQLQKDHEKIQQVVKKREQTMKKLLTVEEQIAQLKAQLEEKTRELTGERKAKAKLIKDKLDAEVKRRLDAQKKGLVTARQELAAAKKEYVQKTQQAEKEHQAKLQQLEHEKKTLAEREKAIMLSEHTAKATLAEVKEQRQKLHQEKREAADVLKDAAHLRKQWDEMKKVDAQTRQNLDEITKRQEAIARAEETLRQREVKVGSDLTKLHEEQERLRELKAEHQSREAQVKKAEADAARLTADAQQRNAAALETERASRERIKNDMKRLDNLRKQIDTSLGKVLKNKQKISTAVALRKHLEESVLKMREDVASDRKAIEEGGYKAYMQTKDAVTPAGQPDVSHADDVNEVKKTDLPIYTKVEECRSALDRHDLETAKRIYSELRQEYSAVRLPAPEKSMLYNSIRELYDDIHLAMLG